MAGDRPNLPVLRHASQQQVDRLGARAVEQTQKWEQRVLAKRENTNGLNKKGPAGGFDATPVPSAPPGYTLRITFHGAENLPFADLSTLSSDPYVLAVLRTPLAKRHAEDADLSLRTPTIHRNKDPTWNTQWTVANVPAAGFSLKCKVYDEDPSDHDDRLGDVYIDVPAISDDWPGFSEQKFALRKRTASRRAYLFRGLATLLCRNVSMSGNLIVSIANLGRTPGDDGGRAYTLGPLFWSRHYSPLIGRLTGTKGSESDKDGTSVEKYNFQAVQMQLTGPVPAQLYHRYVEFRPFVAGMFTDHSLRGRILNRALHHQHARIYNYDRSTKHGVYEEPCIERTNMFLDFVQYDHGGRIFTYVLTLDGQFRFTETGKEFGIDLLSKHTMHSDDGNESSAKATDPPKHPLHYELIIDNDSGTYRPNAKLLPVLRDYMASNFPGLKVITLDCQADEEKMQKLKSEQREFKKKSGASMTFLQNRSLSSISSSDVEDLNDRARDGQVHENVVKHGVHKYLGYGQDEFHGAWSDDAQNGHSGEAKANGNEEKQPSTLIRLAPLRLFEIPAHPDLPIKANVDVDQPDLLPFVATLLSEGLAFLAQPTFSRNFSHHSNHKANPSTANVEVLTHPIPASQLRSQVPWASPSSTGKKPSVRLDNGAVLTPVRRSQPAALRPEHWFARHSRHSNVSSKSTDKPGHASWDEFVYGLRDNHSQHEQDFTPTLYDARKVIDWSGQVAKLEAEGSLARTGFSDVTIGIYEMCHDIPPPMKPRCFGVLVVTASVIPRGSGYGRSSNATTATDLGIWEDGDEEKFVAVTVPVQLGLGTKKAFYANWRNLREGDNDKQKRETEQEIDWLMATASDAKGVLPMWMQKLALPGTLPKDVGYFVKWIKGVDDGTIDGSLSPA
ncbi:hypothetical protein DV737_g1809, partial [Chaetothyriales sp. CBS 132003]